MEELTAPILAHLDHQSPGGVIGVYLFGSAAMSGLRPDSDVDLLVLTRRSLTTAERAELVSLLLAVSGWHGHAARFPDVAHRRPIELTSLVVSDQVPLTEHPRRDFQYGEWMRGEAANGRLPRPTRDPDVVILIATAHVAHRALRGPALGEVLPPVPRTLLHHAVLASIPGILGEIQGDERNALLTLARTLVTLETGHIVSKDEAAETIEPTLAPADRALLARARDGYRGVVHDDWGGMTEQVASLARVLASRAQAHGAP